MKHLQAFLLNSRPFKYNEEKKTSEMNAKINQSEKPTKN